MLSHHKSLEQFWLGESIELPLTTNEHRVKIRSNYVHLGTSNKCLVARSEHTVDNRSCNSDTGNAKENTTGVNYTILEYPPTAQHQMVHRRFVWPKSTRY